MALSRLADVWQTPKLSIEHA